MGIFRKIFKSYSEKEVKRVMPIVDKINGLEEEISKLTDEQFYINFEDALNILSVRDHSGNPEQIKEFKETIESFEADFT